MATNEQVDILDALDLPPETHFVQDNYWHSRREWVKLQEAYALVVADMLRRYEKKED